MKRKIAYITDTHLLVQATASLSMYPHLLALLAKTASRQKAEDLYEKWRQAIAYAFACVCEDLKKWQPDLIVHLGDITSGYRESGSAHPLVQQLLQEAADRLNAIAPTRFCPGNHDVGYRTALSRLGRFSSDNIAICQSMLGPLYWQEDKEDIRLVGLTASLATKGNDEQNSQWQFLQNALHTSNTPIILGVHTPLALQFYQDILHSTRVPLMVICGEYHNGSVPYRGYVRLMQAYLTCFIAPTLQKIILCPSVAPVWWRGYSYLQCELIEGAWSLSQREVRPLDAPDLFIGSPFAYIGRISQLITRPEKIWPS